MICLVAASKVINPVGVSTSDNVTLAGAVVTAIEYTIFDYAQY